MKKNIFLLLALLVITLAGCRSKKEAATVEQAAEIKVEEPTWQNVQMPVRMTIEQPMRMSMNGTLTMVRGEYALLSFRTLGFEVAQAYVTPQQMDMVLKMPSKMWVSEPLGERLTKRDINFTQVQEAMLRNDLKLPKMPNGVEMTCGGTAENPEVYLSLTAKGTKIAVSLTYDLSSAKWDVSNPAKFSTPGAAYRKITLESAAKALGK